MSMYNWANLPFPVKSDRPDDMWNYLTQLRAALMTYSGNLPEHIDKELSLLRYFKTIAGITNSVVADQQDDTLTLASGNSALGIVGTTATDTITFTWAHLGIENLADAGADRILFWDDGDGAVKWLVPTNAISITATALNVLYDGTTIGLNGSNQLYAIAGGVDHGGLAGLTDDDHAQYALLAGRVGGQALIGGTGAGNDLTLTTTSHGTKGDYIFNNATKIFLNDTADADATIGLVINQGVNDDNIVSLKSSDVNHLMTDFVETDTFGQFKKVGAGADGGLAINGYTEVTQANVWSAFYTTDDTAKTTAAEAPIIFNVSKRSGTGRQAPGADANLVAIRKWGGAAFLAVWSADEDGDTWQTGTINAEGAIQIDGTQVVSNRVIDARCDDALNSGDATTDGVIDSLRDAMIAHGLIAAA